MGQVVIRRIPSVATVSLRPGVGQRKQVQRLDLRLSSRSWPVRIGAWWLGLSSKLGDGPLCGAGSNRGEGGGVTI